MKDFATPDIFADHPIMTTKHPITDYDPFARTPDVAPGPVGTASKGYVRKAKTVDEAILGANPELDRNAAATAREKQSAKLTPDDAIPKIIKHAASQGFSAVRTEHRITNYSGVVSKTDWYGLCDVSAIKAVGGNTALRAYQSTTKASVAAHIRKMASDEKFQVPGRGMQRYVDMTREFLKCNGRIFIIGWYFENNRWQFVEFEVTWKVIEDAIGRKRK